MRHNARTRVALCGKFLLIAAALSCPVAPPAAAQQLAAESGLHEAVLDIVINEAAHAEALIVLRDQAQGLWLEAADFARLRLAPPPVAPYPHQGKSYYALQAIPGASLRIDESAQRIDLTVPAAALETTRLLAARRRSTPVTPAELGGFLNYQLSEQRIGSSNVAGAFAELGVFGSRGVLTNTAVARDFSGSRDLLRLDTSFTHDFVDSMNTLNVGDSISDAGAWGSAVRFGGLRFSRNFAIRPDLLTTPLLSATGSAAVPSTVDVFVNNQHVSNAQLPPGPFVIDNLPSITGTGDVRVVVTDALGRTQVMTQRFYSGAGLLAAGLSQYSVDVGKLRMDYAVASNHYGSMVGAATYRRGLSSTLTLEARAEGEASGPHAAGVNVATQVGTFGVLNATLAGGGDTSGSGSLLSIGFEHRGERGSFLLNTQSASRGFRALGQPVDPAARIHQQTTAQAGIDTGRMGTFSVAFVRQTYFGQHSQQTVSLSDSLIAGRAGYLSLSVTRSIGAEASTSVYLLFTRSLGERRSATVTGVGGSGAGAPKSGLEAGMMQNPPVGVGTGWRVNAGTAGTYDLDIRHQFQAGTVEAQAARNQGINGQSLFASGAATLLDGDLRFARQVPTSFAVVEVGDIADLPIYVDNQLVTRTNASGHALVPNLRPYEDNKISVHPEDLPLDTSIGARAIVLAPAYRSGVVARFPVERIRSGTFRLKRPDGTPVPLGAMVEVAHQTFPVVNGGLVYVTGLDHGLGAEAHWGKERCVFRIPPPPAHDPVADLGTLVCRPAGEFPPRDKETTP